MFLFEGGSEKIGNLVFPHIFDNFFIDNRTFDIRGRCFRIFDKEATDSSAEMNVDIIFGVSAKGVDDKEYAREVGFVFFFFIAYV